MKIAGKHIGEVTRPVDPRRQRVVRRAAEAAHQEADRDRDAHPEGDPRPAAVPGRRRPRLPHPVARLGHAVGRREPAHPAGLPDRLRPDRRALRAGRALDRPAPARQRAPARDAEAPARHRQHGDRGRARRGRDPAPPTTWSTSAPAPASTAATSSPQGTPDEIMASADSLTGQYLTGARQIPMPKRAPRSAERQGAQGDRRAREQPEGRHGRDPARPLHLHHRRLRRRQVHAADRHALQGGGAPAQQRARASGRARPHRGPGAPRQGHRHRPVADRPHAALATRPPTPAPSRRSASGSPGCPRPRRAATSRAASPSTSRAGAARPARATASSRSRCTSCPTSTSPATSARASATTARRWR